MAEDHLGQVGLGHGPKRAKTGLYCSPSPFSHIMKTSLPITPDKCISLLAEVKALLDKGTIRKVPVAHRQGGFYATYFLVRKKTGTFRPILNLKPLNVFMRKTNFRMETLKRVIDSVNNGAWLSSIDLWDWYLHVPMNLSEFKFLWFAIQNEVYEFVVLPFASLLHRVCSPRWWHQWHSGCMPGKLLCSPT